LNLGKYFLNKHALNKLQLNPICLQCPDADYFYKILPLFQKQKIKGFVLVPVCCYTRRGHKCEIKTMTEEAGSCTGRLKSTPLRGCLKSLDSSSLRVFISKEQTKETDENIGLSVNNLRLKSVSTGGKVGDVSKGLFRHCERSEAIRKYLIITGLLRRSSSQ
jgi:hypothetical protein